MAFLKQGMSSRGHVISYAGGDDDDYEDKSEPTFKDTHIGPIRSFDPKVNQLVMSPPLNAWISRNPVPGSTQQQLQNGMNHVYKLDGDTWNTLDGSESVYIDGSPLYERGYTVDAFNKTITIHQHITQVADDIEVRFAPERNKFYIIEDLLILQVSDAIPEEDLESYAPEFGDKINLQRILTYKENQRESVDMVVRPGDLEQHGLVMEYKLMPKGIYATLKIYRDLFRV